MSGTAPPSLRSPKFYALLFFVGMLSVYPFARLYQQASINDEGIVCLGALRLLLGHGIYSDFTTHFAPGTYYLGALFYLLFGVTVEATRLAMAACTGGLALLLYLISTRILSPRAALIPYGLFLCGGVTQWPILSYHWLGGLAFLFGVWALLRWVEKPNLSRTAVVGCSISFAVWSLQSSAAALVLLAVGVAVWQRRSFTLRIFGMAVGACLASTLLLWAHPATVSSFQEIWKQNVVWIISHNAVPAESSFQISSLTERWSGFAQAFSVAPKTAATFLWACHSVSYLLLWSVNYGLFYPAFALALLLWFPRRAQTPLTLIVAAHAALLLVWHNRQTMLYLNYLTPLFLLLFTWALVTVFENRSRLKFGTVGLLCAVYLVSYGFQCREAAGYRIPIQTARGVLYTNDPQQGERWQHTFWMAAQHTPPGTKAFCFPYSMGFWFLSGVEPTGWFHVVVPILGPDHEVPTLVQRINSEEIPYIYYAPWSPNTLQAVPLIEKETFFVLAQQYHDQILENYELIQSFPASEMKLYRRKGLTD